MNLSFRFNSLGAISARQNKNMAAFSIDLHFELNIKPHYKLLHKEGITAACTTWQRQKLCSTSFLAIGLTRSHSWNDTNHRFIVWMEGTWSYVNSLGEANRLKRLLFGSCNAHQCHQNKSMASVNKLAWHRPWDMGGGISADTHTHMHFLTAMVRMFQSRRTVIAWF